MSKTDPYAFASLAGEATIKRLQITALPITPQEIAENHGISVVAKSMDDAGCSGMLVRYGNEFAIAYATHHENEGFENFSIAHELGHYFLPGHMDAVIGDAGSHVSRAGFSSVDKYETEADRFAAGFLMPRQLFFPELSRAGTGLDAIISLAALCKTSLHATAIRYAQCTRDPVAIIVSENNFVNHCFMSSSLKNYDGIDWLKQRERVPNNTVSFALNASQENIINNVRMQDTSNLQDWFGGHRRIEIAEDVIGLGRYGKTLTVLHSIELPEPEDEEDERELIESWTPRFK